MSDQPRASARVDPLALALYAPPPPPPIAKARPPRAPEEGLSMSDVQGITTELQFSQEIAARDQALAIAQARIADLEGQLVTLQATVAAQAEQIAAIPAPAGEEVIPVPPDTPQEIVLTSPHGFIDENGINRSWAAGLRIRARQEIALLIGRGADHEVTLGAPPPT